MWLVGGIGVLGIWKRDIRERVLANVLPEISVGRLKVRCRWLLYSRVRFALAGGALCRFPLLLNTRAHLAALFFFFLRLLDRDGCGWRGVLALGLRLLLLLLAAS